MFRLFRKQKATEGKCSPKPPLAPPSSIPHNQVFPLGLPGDPAFRLTCNEIAEQLSKSWRFKLHVGGLVVLGLVTLAGAVGGIIGWSISSNLAHQREQFEKDAGKSIATARDEIEKQIAEQFKKENVQRTVETAASTEASTLLAKSVDPAIKQFQAKIDVVNADVERRSKDLDQVVRRSEQVATSMEGLEGELGRLKQRNDFTTLADKAISLGDVEAYRKLEKLAEDASTDEDRTAIFSEMIRVFQAYSVFSGVSRTANVHLNAHAINPAKTTEDELEVEDLLPLLRIEQESLARVKVGELLLNKVKTGSYKTAEALDNALKGETNLEAMKVLGAAFNRVTGRPTGGKPDQRELLSWWEENKDRLKKADTDPTPSPGASVTPAKP